MELKRLREYRELAKSFADGAEIRSINAHDVARCLHELVWSVEELETQRKNTSDLSWDRLEEIRGLRVEVRRLKQDLRRALHALKLSEGDQPIDIMRRHGSGCYKYNGPNEFADPDNAPPETDFTPFDQRDREHLATVDEMPPVDDRPRAWLIATKGVPPTQYLASMDKYGWREWTTAPGLAVKFNSEELARCFMNECRLGAAFDAVEWVFE